MINPELQAIIERRMKEGKPVVLYTPSGTFTGVPVRSERGAVTLSDFSLRFTTPHGEPVIDLVNRELFVDTATVGAVHLPRTTTTSQGW